MKIINLDFLISITETQTKVKIRLSRVSTENKKCFSLRDHSLGFYLNKTKGKPLREVVLLLFKKKPKRGEIGNIKRRKCSAYLERIKKQTNI